MGRLWNKWLVPALFAVILFLCIRVANDIPKHEYYWESNEWNFMLKDMLVVLFMSYPIFFLLRASHTTSSLVSVSTLPSGGTA